MNQVKLNDLVKEKKVVLPLYFLKMYKDFNLNIDEFILLSFLYDQDNTVFDPGFIAENLDDDILNVMANISNLTDKGLININTVKNDKGIMEEKLDLSPLFDKITLKLMGKLNTKEETSLNIHNLIEKEFNRNLSPLEHEMVDDWDKNGFDKNLVKEAVKEASLNGVSNLRYIDKILIEWAKKGYKVPGDIEKNKEEVKEKVEVFNCDWLNDDEEI